MISVEQGLRGLGRIRQVALAASALALFSCATTKQLSGQAPDKLLEALQAESAAAAAQAQQSLAQIAEAQAQTAQSLAQLNSQVEQLNQRVDTYASRSSARRQASSALKNNRAKADKAQSQQIYGRVEWLWLPNATRYFSAVINTALPRSIVFANDLVRFERDGTPWVRFKVERKDWVSEVEAKVLDNDRVDYLGAKSSLKGAVVSLPVTLGTYDDNIEFVIVEKKKNYPQFVLGRNFLTDIALVDVSKKYLVSRDSKRLSSQAAARKRWQQSLANQEK